MAKAPAKVISKVVAPAKAAPATKAAPAPVPKPTPAAAPVKQTASKPSPSLPSIPQVIKAPAAVASSQVAKKILPMPTPSPSPGTAPKPPAKSSGLFGSVGNALKKAGSFVGNELLGLDDFGNVVKHAKNGDWGKAAKSLGAGAFEMGTTALMLVPGVGTAAGAAIKAGATAGKVGAKQVVKQAVAKPMAQKVVSQASKAATKTKDGLKTAQTVVKKAASSGATKATQASKAAVQVGKKTVGAVKTQTAKIATKVVDNIPGIGKAAAKLKAPARVAGAAVKGSISKIGKFGKNKIVNPLKSKLSQGAKKAKDIVKRVGAKLKKGGKKLKKKTKIRIGAGIAKLPGIIGGLDDGPDDGSDGDDGNDGGNDGNDGGNDGGTDPDPDPKPPKKEEEKDGKKDPDEEKPNMDSTQTLDLISQGIDNIGQDVLDAFLGNIIESIELEPNNLLTSITLLQVDGLAVSSTIGTKDSSYNLPKASGSIFANQLPDSGYKLYSPILSPAIFATKAKFGTSSTTGFVENKVKTDVSGMPKYDLKLELPDRRGIATYEVQYIMENIT
jgi:hypothetical protein